MSFETPAALWALSSLLLLVIFSLWRQAAAKTVVPSILLWKRIPERNPPIRALRRPKWRVQLLLQALAIAAAVCALAGPFLSTSKPKPRKVAFVFDTSARMQAGGRLEKAKAEARRLMGGPLADDVVGLYAAVPAPTRLKSVDDVRGIDAHVDLEPLIAAARQEAEHVIVLSDRPVTGAHSILFGSEAANAGIVEFTATEGEVFVRVANGGAPRRATVRLEWGGQKVEETATLPGVWFRKGDFSKAPEVRVEIDGADPLPMDDAVRATRLGATRVGVGIGGTPLPLLQRALGAVPGVMVGGEPLLSVGVDERPAKAPFSVWLHSPQGRSKPAAWDPVRHPLLEGVRTGELGAVGELPPEARQGEAVLVADGKRVGVLKDGVLHLCIDLDPKGWASTPSFPIFWQNVVEFAGKGAGGFAVVRTGRPHPVPGEVTRAPAGALWSLSPAGQFLAFTRGEYVLRTADGDRRVEANLLDPRESDTAGMSRALDWDPAAPAGREFARNGLAGWAAALALLFVGLAWLAQRRAD